MGEFLMRKIFVGVVLVASLFGSEVSFAGETIVSKSESLESDGMEVSLRDVPKRGVGKADKTVVSRDCKSDKFGAFFKTKNVVYHNEPTSVTNEVAAPDVPGVSVDKSMIIRPSTSAPFYRVVKSYERDARPIVGLVIHHSATPTLSGLISAMSSRDPARGYGDTNYGYMYVIDKSGKVYQTAPRNIRTNHIQGGTNRVPGSNVQNYDHLGVACLGNSCNSRQLASLKQLALGLIKQNPAIVSGGVVNIVGHGDVNTDHGGEQVKTAALLRSFVKEKLGSKKCFETVGK
jgi:hypothetical protein